MLYCTPYVCVCLHLHRSCYLNSCSPATLSCKYSISVRQCLGMEHADGPSELCMLIWPRMFYIFLNFITRKIRFWLLQSHKCCIYCFGHVYFSDLLKLAAILESKKSKIMFQPEVLSTLGSLLLDVHAVCQPKPIDYENRRKLVQKFNKLAVELFGNRMTLHLPSFIL